MSDRAEATPDPLPPGGCLLSRPRTREPRPLSSTRDIARIVARTPQALTCLKTGAPRTCCVTRSALTSADAGPAVGVIRELEGRADIRTTTVYTAVPAHLDMRNACSLVRVCPRVARRP